MNKFFLILKNSNKIWANNPEDKKDKKIIGKIFQYIFIAAIYAYLMICGFLFMKNTMGNDLR